MTAEQLKNSILQMAVSGKLVPQDTNDEPASVLLNQIRAEKGQLIKEGKIKKEKNPSHIFRGANNTFYEVFGNGEPVNITDEVPFEIPDSWEWVRLGMISTYAQTKKKINARDADPTIWGLDLEDIEKGGRLLSKLTVGERKAIGDKTCFYKGDILYSKLRPYLLKILIAEDDGICTPEIVPFKVYGNINAEYIVTYLHSPFVDGVINAATYGVKMPRAGTETMTSLLVPLPPIAEQNRIVAKINEIYPFINQYKVKEQSLATLNKNFPEQLRKSILQIAIQGKLVPQNPEEGTARDLMVNAATKDIDAEGQRVKQKVITEISDDEKTFDIPNSWEWIKLGSICTIARGGSPRPIKEYITDSPDGVNWIKIGDTEKNGKYISTTAEKIKPSGVVKSRMVHDGDFLLTNSMSFGRPYILKTDGCIHDGWLVISQSTEAFDQDYLYWLLSSGYAYSQFCGKVSGAVVKNLNSEKVANSVFPLPPLQEQKRIVEKLEELLSLCEALMV